MFDEEDLPALAAICPTLEGKTQKQKNPHPHHSLAWAAWAIARLGGWKGYASDRPPGPETFTRGLQRFTAIVEGFAIARQPLDKKSDKQPAH